MKEQGSGHSCFLPAGLDARAAAIVMRAVRNIVNTGRTIVCTIHQPSIDIFESFDELLLLKRGGETIFNGQLGKDSKDLIEYFQVGSPACSHGLKKHSETKFCQRIPAISSGNRLQALLCFDRHSQRCLCSITNSDLLFEREHSGLPFAVWPNIGSAASRCSSECQHTLVSRCFVFLAASPVATFPTHVCYMMAS